jgi:hypothetical protein
MSSYFEQRLAEIGDKAELVTTPPRRRRHTIRSTRPLVGTKLGYVYFITDGEADAVKIGFATNVGSRLSSLGTGNFRKLTVQTEFRTYIEAERMLHRHFKADRIKGEWFRLTGDIEEFWDDIFDYQGCHGTGSTGDEFLDSMDNTIIGLDDLKTMLANIGTPWHLI